MMLKYSYHDGGLHPKAGQVLYEKIELLNNNIPEGYKKYLLPAISGCARDLEDCKWVLERIEEFEQNSQPITIEGEQIEATLTDKGVQIDMPVHEDWMDDPEGLFTLEQFKTAMVGWKKFLELPKSLESAIEIELPNK